jgi:hypothetical protein
MRKNPASMILCKVCCYTIGAAVSATVTIVAGPAFTGIAAATAYTLGGVGLVTSTIGIVMQMTAMNIHGCVQDNIEDRLEEGNLHYAQSLAEKVEKNGEEISWDDLIKLEATLKGKNPEAIKVVLEAFMANNASLKEEYFIKSLQPWLEVILKDENKENLFSLINTLLNRSTISLEDPLMKIILNSSNDWAKVLALDIFLLHSKGKENEIANDLFAKYSDTNYPGTTLPKLLANSSRPDLAEEIVKKIVANNESSEEIATFEFSYREAVGERSIVNNTSPILILTPHAVSAMEQLQQDLSHKFGDQFDPFKENEGEEIV